ncbi:MAG: hypothetical protein V6Z86_05105 [Hyphomicrobiales bacterium]
MRYILHDMETHDRFVQAIREEPARENLSVRAVDERDGDVKR